MNFGFFRKNRSVVYNWIVSYMVLILIPVVLTGSVYFIAKKTIEAEINNSNMLVLENIRSNLDNTLGEVDKFSIEIAANQDIQDAYNLSEIDYTSYYTLYQAASDLRNYKIFSSSLQSFYIYLNNVKMVLSPGVVNSANYYFSGYVSSKGYDISDWINAVSRIHNGEYTLMPYHQNVLEDTKTVAFIRTFPIPSFGNISANLVVMMDFSSLTDKNTSDRSVFIIDSQSNIMAQSDTKSKYTGINYKELRGNEGVLTKSIGGKRVVISYITLNENNWKCITVTPEAVFWQKAEFIRDIMIGGLFVCLLLGGLMAYYFIKRNYDPLKEVISYFRLKVYSENVYDNNEFNYITRALNTQMLSLRMYTEKAFWNSTGASARPWVCLTLQLTLSFCFFPTGLAKNSTIQAYGKGE
jgi:two-component system response regulator YesN